MPAVSLETLHRSERRLQPVHGIVRSDPTEIPRRDDRQKVETHVCRRCAMGDHGFRIFLKVVRRKCMLLRGDERFKKAPRSARGQPQRLCIRARHWIRAREK